MLLHLSLCTMNVVTGVVVGMATYLARIQMDKECENVSNILKLPQYPVTNLNV